jgi:hypothetical protein
MDETIGRLMLVNIRGRLRNRYTGALEAREEIEDGEAEEDAKEEIFSRGQQGDQARGTPL